MIEHLSTEQLAAEGKKEFEAGKYLSAAKSFKAAMEGYNLAGDPARAAEMANNCCVALLQADEPGEALSVVKDTVSVFEKLDDVKRQAMALGNRAAALEALNRLEEAEADYQRSAELLKEVGEDELRMNVMQSLSALKLRSGRSLEALADMQSGVEGIEKPKPRHRLLKRLLEVPTRLINR